MRVTADRQQSIASDGMRTTQPTILHVPSMIATRRCVSAKRPAAKAGRNDQTLSQRTVRRMKPAAQHRDLFTRRWRQEIPPAKETAFHIQLVSILRWALRPDVLMWHVPNGGYRDDREAAKLKAMGVLPGVSDLQFHWIEIDALQRKCRRVLHLELKAGNGRLSDTQATFALAVKLLGDRKSVV